MPALRRVGLAVMAAFVVITPVVVSLFATILRGVSAVCRGLYRLIR